MRNVLEIFFKDRWNVEELSAVMHMPTAAIRRKIAFWQSHGLLKEEATDTFLLVEEHKGSRTADVLIVEEDESESAMASASDQREEEMQVCLSLLLYGVPKSCGILMFVSKKTPNNIMTSVAGAPLLRANNH